MGLRKEGDDSDTKSSQTEVTLGLVGATESFRNCYQLSPNEVPGTISLSFPLTWHLTMCCFVIGYRLPVFLSSCLSQ